MYVVPDPVNVNLRRLSCLIPNTLASYPGDSARLTILFDTVMLFGFCTEPPTDSMKFSKLLLSIVTALPPVVSENVDEDADNV